MTNFIKKRIQKYLVYIVSLPIISLGLMLIVDNIMRGAHGAGYFGMIVGVIIAQTFFSIVLLNFKWYICLPLGLLIGILTIYLSYTFINLLDSLSTKDKYGDSLDERFLEWVFFILLIVISICFWELTNYIGKKSKRAKATP